MTSEHGQTDFEPATDEDLALLTRELGRAPRGVLGVAYRCDYGMPAVVQTAPRLPDGTPFPTLFYLCCPGRCSGSAGWRPAGSCGSCPPNSPPTPTSPPTIALRTSRTWDAALDRRSG